MQRALLLLGARRVQAQAPPESRPGKLGGYIRSGDSGLAANQFDVVVVGGGIAGTCAAIAAARNSARTALVHERSMLGGNASSEVRLYPENSCGRNIWCREMGILDEITVEERVRNHEPYQEGVMNAVWDLVLYEWVVREPNISLYLNTTMREVEMKDRSHILAIHAVQLGTEKELSFQAPLFIDCTGDGVLGYRAGAEYRWGMEARDELDEPRAPEKASDRPIMGSTLFFRARDAGVPVPFKRPSFATEFPTEADLTGRGHSRVEHGYWWIEVGLPMHQIHGNEEIKHEALRQLLGVWDHIKNKCTRKEKAANYGLEFVGFWPYKREARRIMGDYILKQRDVQDPRMYNDAIAGGCWFIDIHEPGGILDRQHPNPSMDWEREGTLNYGIPLRACYSKNIQNLMMAGRPISTSYVAFGSTRVLRTCAAVGQGVGTAAAVCARYNCPPRTLARDRWKELQQTLLRQDCFLPGAENEDPLDLARKARITGSSAAALEFPESSEFAPLEFPAAQIFPVATGSLDSVELLLKSESSAATRLTLGLRKADFVYDFRSAGDVATASAVVPARFQGYVRFAFGLAVEPRSMYWVHLPKTGNISWSLYGDEMDTAAGMPPGTSCALRTGPTRWEPLRGNQCFVLRVAPQQQPYGPENVARGTNRPDRWPNIYVSSDLPAWVELEWPKTVTVGMVQLAFDTDVNRLSRRPLFRYPDCVKRYEIHVLTAGSWKTVVTEPDNYFRRRVHTFAQVETRRLRIRLLETNGAKSARMYEVRVYSASPHDVKRTARREPQERNPL